jgi:hypothetical protein
MHFVSPAYLAVLLAPVALLSRADGLALVRLGHVGTVLLLGHRWHWPWWAVVAVAVSVPSVANIQEGQTDWMSVAGLTVPGVVGAALMLSKPQVGGWLTLLAVRRVGFRRAAPALLFVGLLWVVGSVLYGAPDWESVLSSHWNWGKLGMLLGGPVGLVLLGRGLWVKSERMVLAGSVLVSPYQTLRTLGWAMWGLPPKWAAVVSGLTWLGAGVHYVFTR